MSERQLVKYDPTVNLGTLIQAVSLIIFMIAGYTVMQVQISINSRDIDSLKTTDDAIREEFKEFKTTYREDNKELRNNISELNINVTRALQKLEGQ